MRDTTIVYTVGGSEEHYDNMFRSIKSIHNLNKNYRYLIYELGTSLEQYNHPLVTVYNLPKEIDFSKEKIGYQIWLQKYKACLLADTDYVVYADSDTAMANDNLNDIFSIIREDIGVVPHFWVPTVGSFEKKAVPGNNRGIFRDVIKNLNVNENDTFFAGGFFAYKNNQKNRECMSYIIEKYQNFYSKNEYTKGITDELYLSASVKKFGYKPLSGAANHCSMGDNHMPMNLKDGILYGKNPNEENFEKITFLHCDINRRDPRESYDANTRKIIESAFIMSEKKVGNL